ncbi:MAG TPA: hypothetical protein VGC18_06950 [Lacisediminihabitans sp.]|uniref:hypothetical protein n=1 Tax=Lacisediminihabitans sp. TaxID=2787631 RepID=UPI002ED9CB9F
MTAEPANISPPPALPLIPLVPATPPRRPFLRLILATVGMSVLIVFTIVFSVIWIAVTVIANLIGTLSRWTRR